MLNVRRSFAPPPRPAPHRRIKFIRLLPPLLQLKQEISRLSLRERRELNAYLIRLRHERPEWKRMISRRMRAMDAGRKLSLDELELRPSRP